VTDIDTLLARGRAAAEALHTSTFNVLRPTGQTTEDPVTLKEVPVLTTRHTAIRGKFQTGQAQTREAEAPGVKIADTTLEWHCSVAVVDILTDDIIECTTSPADPSHPGVRVRVIGPFIKSLATARRFPVELLS
jgi:hypothetical protein